MTISPNTTDFHRPSHDRQAASRPIGSVADAADWPYHFAKVGMLAFCLAFWAGLVYGGFSAWG